MSRDLRKIRESEREIHFAYSPAGAWIGALVWVGLVWWAVTGLEGGTQLVVGGLGALLLLSGVSSALYRLEFEAVVLEKELERRGSDRVDEWEVKLVLQGWPRPLEVLETKDEATARRQAEDLAARLGVEVRERTGY